MDFNGVFPMKLIPLFRFLIEASVSSWHSEIEIVNLKMLSAASARLLKRKIGTLLQVTYYLDFNALET